jgi:KUP system potassium uptake protein
VYRITLSFGFMEKPDVPAALKENIELIGIGNLDQASYFVGRENIFATELPGMALWREKLFAVQSKNETPASEYFKLPKDRVLEIGTQVAI